MMTLMTKIRTNLTPDPVELIYKLWWNKFVHWSDYVEENNFCRDRKKDPKV